MGRDFDGDEAVGRDARLDRESDAPLEEAGSGEEALVLVALYLLELCGHVKVGAVVGVVALGGELHVRELRRHVDVGFLAVGDDDLRIREYLALAEALERAERKTEVVGGELSGEAACLRPVHVGAGASCARGVGYSAGYGVAGYVIDGGLAS